MGKVLDFPKDNAHHARVSNAEIQALQARAAEQRRFLEALRDSNVDLHTRIDRMEATMNATLREIKKLVRGVHE